MCKMRGCSWKSKIFIIWKMEIHQQTMCVNSNREKRSSHCGCGFFIRFHIQSSNGTQYMPAISCFKNVMHCFPSSKSNYAKLAVQHKFYHYNLHIIFGNSVVLVLLPHKNVSTLVNLLGMFMLLSKLRKSEVRL